jgi:hypothetical protein
VLSLLGFMLFNPTYVAMCCAMCKVGSILVCFHHMHLRRGSVVTLFVFSKKYEVDKNAGLLTIFRDFPYCHSNQKNSSTQG